MVAAPGGLPNAPLRFSGRGFRSVSFCPIEREKTVSTTTLSSSDVISRHQEVAVCGAPLFGDRSLCDSCSSGWEVEGNKPTDAGRAQIAAFAVNTLTAPSTKESSERYESEIHGLRRILDKLTEDAEDHEMLSADAANLVMAAVEEYAKIKDDQSTPRVFHSDPYVASGADQPAGGFYGEPVLVEPEEKANNGGRSDDAQVDRVRSYAMRMHVAVISAMEMLDNTAGGWDPSEVQRVLRCESIGPSILESVHAEVVFDDAELPGVVAFLERAIRVSVKMLDNVGPGNRPHHIRWVLSDAIGQCNPGFRISEGDILMHRSISGCRPIFAKVKQVGNRRARLYFRVALTSTKYAWSVDGSNRAPVQDHGVWVKVKMKLVEEYEKAASEKWSALMSSSSAADRWAEMYRWVRVHSVKVFGDVFMSEGEG